MRLCWNENYGEITLQSIDMMVGRGGKVVDHDRDPNLDLKQLLWADDETGEYLEAVTDELGHLTLTEDGKGIASVLRKGRLEFIFPDKQCKPSTLNCRESSPLCHGSAVTA